MSTMQHLKFSDETQKYQAILRVRKSTVGAQLKFVIDLLYKTRKALTAHEIEVACHVIVDPEKNKDVFKALTNNPKVHYDGKLFSYKPKHNIKGKEDLLALIRRYLDGIFVSDLSDAYPSVIKDLQALKATGDIWIMSNRYAKDKIVYPNDRKMEIKVDDGLKEEFRSIKLPNEMLEVEKELKKFGMKPATNTAKRRDMATVHCVQKSESKHKKEKRIKKLTRLTNSHLLDSIPDLLS